MDSKLIKSGIAALLLSAGVIAGNAFHAQSAKAQAPVAAAKPFPLAGAWTIDPAHTSVTFSIKHFGISEVHGRFDDVSGNIVADPAHPSKSSVDITIKASSINTDQAMRDADVKSKNYLDTGAYPTITFHGTSVKKAAHGSYVAVGNLTIRGVTKVISLPFTIAGPIHDPFGGTRIGIVTQTTITRTDYGVGGKDKISDGSFAIGNEIPIQISVEAVPAKVAA